MDNRTVRVCPGSLAGEEVVVVHGAIRRLGLAPELGSVDGQLRHDVWSMHGWAGCVHGHG